MKKGYISHLSPAEVYSINQQLIDILYNIVKSVSDDPQISLTKITRSGKPTFNIIYDAEDQFRQFVASRFQTSPVGGQQLKILVAGDENHHDLDLKNTKSVCALVSMVDNEDALEYGFQNWCASVVFFHPQLGAGMKILGSFVGLHSQEVYFATNTLRWPFVQGPTGKPRSVSGPSSVQSLDGARICFHEKTGENLVTNAADGPPTHDQTGYVSFNNEKTRIYTVAGTPMIMKLVDTGDVEVRSMDAVIELDGRFPYEVIAGVYIAKKAGATIIDHDTGLELTYENLEAALMKPFCGTSKLRMIITATPQLARQIVFLLNGSHYDFSAGRPA